MVYTLTWKLITSEVPQRPMRPIQLSIFTNAKEEDLEHPLTKLWMRENCGNG